MIYCVRFPDFLAYIASIDFELVGNTDTDLMFRRKSDGAVLAVHRSNHRGDITEASALAACDDAEVELPKLDVHWCDRRRSTSLPMTLRDPTTIRASCPDIFSMEPTR